MRLKRSTLVPESDITDKAFVQIRRMWLPEQNPDFIQVRTNIGFTWKIISHLALGCLSNKVEELEQNSVFPIYCPMFYYLDFNSCKLQLQRNYSLQKELSTHQHFNCKNFISFYRK